MPRSADTSTSYQASSAMTADEVQHVRWAGWAILLTVTLCWVGWVSLLAISSQTAIETHAQRIDLHYQQLHDQLTEVRGDVKTLLTRNGSDANYGSHANRVLSGSDQ